MIRPKPLWLWIAVLTLIFAASALLRPRDAPMYVVPEGEIAAARSALDTLQVHDATDRQDYRREAFGEGWADLDGDGCRTRDDVLRRDLDRVERVGCHVTDGELVDPYGGVTVTVHDVEIDHVVALADAWRSGAWAWTPTERVAFANDPLNLLAVDGQLNQDKGASNAAEWLPLSRTYRCPYVVRQIAVKERYGLSVTSDERAALERELNHCHSTPG